MTEPQQIREYQIAKWNAFDDGGHRLPRKSTAAKWRRRQLVLIFTLAFSVEVLSIGVGILFPLFHHLFVLPMFLFGIPAIIAYDFAKRRFLRQWAGEERPTEPIVGVRFVVDGFEYGRDFGFINFEKDWIYFAGERTTFSLGRGDFEYEFAKASQIGSNKPVFRLNRTTPCVEIRMDGISIADARLHVQFLQWLLVAKKSQGISVLPPLQSSDRKDYDRWQEAGASAGIGCVTFSAILAISVFLLGSTLWLIPHVLLFGVLLGSTAATVGAHRMFVSQRRAKAFRHLVEVRNLLGPAALAGTDLEPREKDS